MEMLIDDETDCLLFILYIFVINYKKEKKCMHLVFAYYGIPCDFIALKLRINLHYILEMSIKNSKKTIVVVIASLTNSSCNKFKESYWWCCCCYC